MNCSRRKCEAIIVVVYSFLFLCKIFLCLIVSTFQLTFAYCDFAWSKLFSRSQFMAAVFNWQMNKKSNEQIKLKVHRNSAQCLYMAKQTKILQSIKKNLQTGCFFLKKSHKLFASFALRMFEPNLWHNLPVLQSKENILYFLLYRSTRTSSTANCCGTVLLPQWWRPSWNQDWGSCLTRAEG